MRQMCVCSPEGEHGQLVSSRSVKVLLTDFYLTHPAVQRAPRVPVQTLRQLDPGSGFTTSYYTS